MEEWYEIKVGELRRVTCKIEYKDKLNQRWERVREEIVGGGGWRKNGEGLRKQSWKR